MSPVNIPTFSFFPNLPHLSLSPSSYSIQPPVFFPFPTKIFCSFLSFENHALKVISFLSFLLIPLPFYHSLTHYLLTWWFLSFLTFFLNYFLPLIFPNNHNFPRLLMGTSFSLFSFFILLFSLVHHIINTMALRFAPKRLLKDLEEMRMDPPAVLSSFSSFPLILLSRDAVPLPLMNRISSYGMPPSLDLKTLLGKVFWSWFALFNYWCS